MTAVLLTGFGGLDRLVVRDDVPVPQPRAGEVLIAVGAAGINNTDLWTREGAYGSEDDPKAVAGWHREPLRFPRIQGGDIAGRIVAVGPGVPSARIGERVLVDPALYAEGREDPVGAGIIGSERDGGYAEYVTVPAANAHSVDTGLPDCELASFPITYATALGMLNRAHVSEGETVFVTGASGGVGSALVQLACLRGCRVVAMVGAGKEERARELGASAVLTRSADDDIVASLRAFGIEAADVVCDVVGGEMFSKLLALLRPLGRYVTAGAIAGPMVTLDLRTLYLKHLKLIGSTMWSRGEFDCLARIIQEGKVRPVVAATYPLSEVRRAQADFREKAFFGKLVLLPQGGVKPQNSEVVPWSLGRM